MSVLEKASIFDLMKIHSRYVQDFPKGERKPYWMIVSNYYLRGRSDILVLKEKGSIISYAITLKKSRYAYVLVDYLDTFSEYRSKGYGKLMLQKLKEFYHDRAGILVEIEALGQGDTDEENVLRDRRWSFYEKNGFRMESVELILFGIPMHMLYLPIQIQQHPAPLRDIAYDMYHQGIGKEFTDKNIFVREKD